MINLLPRDYQVGIRKERLQRFIVALGILFFLIITANIILLSPLWLSLALQKNELEREFDSIRQSSIFAEVTDIEAAIQKLNMEIRLFNLQEQERSEFIPEFRAIIKSAPLGIKIESFIFEKRKEVRDEPTQILISGKAQNRDLLLRFTEVLESNELFTRIHSPISNLLKETNIEYSLRLELKEKSDASS